ncbi:hypothetical protein TRP8649_04036 [Pelagimonas phthalicica]|uniref:Autotransporter beta-domain-containing protein n=1 Tax=Pelagimonas phthalicica TaxID=1037362 RepID=A0A238JJC4_9RHOB|nr:hypothetical protein [Pelagimonas phthalicica]TDS89728.1 hypothetical protein CLV87_3780 [Pelagimonas phthalicica]SMX29896.1 hypothetical protein TRP8649_04036 [Pelagimonas phthalicica]
MKTFFAAALAVSFAMPATVMAQGGPPQAVKTQQNLGAAGLLGSFFSGAQFGTTRARSGENAARRGAAGAPGAAQSGYKHETVTALGLISGRKLLNDGASYLTFGASFNNKEERPNLTDIDTQIPSIGIGYQNFSNQNTAYAAYLTFSSRDSRGETVHSRRKYYELRFDVAHKFSDHWGVTGRLVHTRGDLKVDVTTPFGVVATVEPQTVWYGQAELVGNFTSDDAGFVPKGWVLNPILGISHDTEITGSSSSTKDVVESGSVWAKATLSKLAGPGTWSPNFTLGLEHEYLQEGAEFIDEDTYGIMGAGLTRRDKKGNAINVVFERRQGFNGNRVSNVLVTGYSFNF